MASRYMPQQGNSSTSYSLYGTGGLNLGAWRLRTDYQYNRYDSGKGLSQSDFLSAADVSVSSPAHIAVKTDTGADLAQFRHFRCLPVYRYHADQR